MTLSRADIEVAGAGSGPRAERPRRRVFTAEYRLAMVEEYDRLSQPGAKGALLRREGLYSSHIIEWRRARDAGTLAGVNDTPRRASGNRASGKKTAEERENERLAAENARLAAEL